MGLTDVSRSERVLVFCYGYNEKIKAKKMKKRNKPRCLFSIGLNNIQQFLGMNLAKVRTM